MAIEKNLIENYPVLVDLIDEMIENIDHVISTPEKVYLDKKKRDQRRTDVLSAIFGITETERADKTRGVSAFQEDKDISFVKNKMEEENLSLRGACYKYHLDLQGTGNQESKYRRIKTKIKRSQQPQPTPKETPPILVENIGGVFSYKGTSSIEEDLIRADLSLISKTLKKYSGYVNEITNVK